MYEFLDHMADVGVRLRSKDGPSLFQDAASALVAIILDASTSQPPGAGERVEIQLEAEDGEALLVDFLNELIFLFDTKRFLPGRLEVKLLTLEAPARMEASILGERLDPSRHVAKTEVKAATFHDMKLVRTAEGLQTDVVFDL